jgi:putative transcriptional regulator
MSEQRMRCNLKNYMDSRNLNIAQLSREIGLAENTVRSYVQNRFNRIDNIAAMKLCQFFGATMGEMFEIVSE